MPRLFTAIEIPETVRMHLSLIRAPLAGAKWIGPENMHITLRFAGDIDGRSADELTDRLASISARPFVVTVQGVGAFGGREPKVLWAGVQAGAELDALARAHDRAARAVGLESEGRSFKPHVTLARMRGARQGAVARFLEENGDLRTPPFTATRCVLLSARPGTGGGPYVVEAEFPFEGTDTPDGADWSIADPNRGD
jgi:RNA 2',3'-cyclic 3'-phosphodiesterase